MTALVALQEVGVQAGDRCLLQVPRLQVAAGERVAIVGPNGAGKSTLLRVAGGLLAPTSGRATVLGQALPAAGEAPLRRAAWRRLRRDIGWLMQGLHLVPRLTARENVLVGALARLHGPQALLSWARWYPAALQAEADEALAALGLAAQAGQRTDRLSGGERQKLGLARLQLQQARLVLADEPTSALDPQATQQVCAALRAATAAPGRALLTVVHDVALLPLLATRVLGLAQGRIVFDLPLAAVDAERLQALYSRPPEAAATGAASLPARPFTPAPACR